MQCKNDMPALALPLRQAWGYYENVNKIIRETALEANI